MTDNIRTVSTDPGLMTPEELLASHKGGRRKTLEKIIAKHKTVERNSAASFLTNARDKIRWFLDHARLKISVSRTT